MSVPKEHPDKPETWAWPDVVEVHPTGAGWVMTINWPDISTFGTIHGKDLKTLNEVAWTMWQVANALEGR